MGCVACGAGFLLFQHVDDCGELVCRAERAGQTGAGVGGIQFGVLLRVYAGYFAVEL